MPHRDQRRPGRSRRVRTLLEDVRDDEREVRRSASIGRAGEVPAAMRALEARGSSPERPESRLFRCPCCPAKHTADKMIAVEELEGSMIDDLPPEVEYICSWCDQHGRRMGRIQRDVP